MGGTEGRRDGRRERGRDGGRQGGEGGRDGGRGRDYACTRPGPSQAGHESPRRRNRPPLQAPGPQEAGRGGCGVMRRAAQASAEYQRTAQRGAAPGPSLPGHDRPDSSARSRVRRGCPAAEAAGSGRRGAARRRAAPRTRVTRPYAVPAAAPQRVDAWRPRPQERGPRRVEGPAARYAKRPRRAGRRRRRRSASARWWYCWRLPSWRPTRQARRH